MSYAGDLTPNQAWDLLRDEEAAVLVDVRTDAEWAFVGVPDLSEVGKQPVMEQWSTLAGGPRPGDFVTAVSELVAPDAPVVLLCRSGQRSIAAAQALTAAGYARAYNIIDGFEGPVDEAGHRGGRGWRADGLPWRQQ